MNKLRITYFKTLNIILILISSTINVLSQSRFFINDEKDSCFIEYDKTKTSLNKCEVTNFSALDSFLVIDQKNQLIIFTPMDTRSRDSLEWNYRKKLIYDYKNNTIHYDTLILKIEDRMKNSKNDSLYIDNKDRIKMVVIVNEPNFFLYFEKLNIKVRVCLRLKTREELAFIRVYPYSGTQWLKAIWFDETGKITTIYTTSGSEKTRNRYTDGLTILLDKEKCQSHIFHDDNERTIHLRLRKLRHRKDKDGLKNFINSN